MSLLSPSLARSSGLPSTVRLRSDPLLGRTIGDFRLERLLGRGSSGRVYRAIQLSLRRTVAVKILDERHLDHTDVRDRFLREAELIARLEHPNIIPVYAAGRAQGLYYFAMRLADGDCLDEVLSRGLSLSRGVKYVLQILSALAFAHGRGVIHRDVKPANILVSDDAAVLTDFGLARHIDMSSTTRSGALLGTPLYLAPELARGERATAHSDLYSTAIS